ncbi:hypothetical protein VMCG_06906 [Cytospora schulzeri]|uniref:Uncharacterized protein n=1 Tax=Cytospora schulzeri TaxID=448051 RepID=A0A423W253_9PEZI|nr:hypothetical protein VMCG_06906 [Valsa malicola]
MANRDHHLLPLKTFSNLMCVSLRIRYMTANQGTLPSLPSETLASVLVQSGDLVRENGQLMCWDISANVSANNDTRELGSYNFSPVRRRPTGLIHQLKI